MASNSVTASMKVSGKGPQMQDISYATKRYLTDSSPSVVERLLSRAANGHNGSEAANENLQALEAMMKQTTREVGAPRE
ncbi:hypothetical protein ACHAQH_001901 [Verticillium albo-atrum]